MQLYVISKYVHFDKCVTQTLLRSFLRVDLEVNLHFNLNVIKCAREGD